MKKGKALGLLAFRLDFMGGARVYEGGQVPPAPLNVPLTTSGDKLVEKSSTVDHGGMGRTL